MVMPCVIGRGGGRFCQRACYRAAMRPPSGPERTCTRCGETKPIEQFQKRGEYRVTFCNACHNQRLRAKYDANPAYAEERRLAAQAWREENPSAANAGRRRYLDRHPDRQRARYAVREAIADGHLVREPCWCGDPDTQAHHHRGYAPDHAIDVVWLCRVHHGESHRKSRRCE
jgi:hypothetical protein